MLMPSAKYLEQEQSKWITKSEAAAMLLTSVRTIERHIEGMEIETAKRARRGRPPETICNRADVERLLPAAHVMPDQQLKLMAPSDKSEEKNQTAKPLDLQFIEFIQLVQTLRPLQLPELPPWLTGEQAAEFSGLSIKFLKREAKRGNITAVRDQGAWKFNRQSLQKFPPKSGSEPSKETGAQ